MIGKKLAHYEIVEKIGAGGMGEVYRARDPKLGRDVALKILPETFAADAERLQRFEREARLLASLSHPNIGSIFGLEHSDGYRFLVLEVVEGEDLSQRISRGALGVEESLAIAEAVANALETAHEQGVIHRDLKPANIKVTPAGQVKVLDFGLAKVMDPSGGSQPDLSHSPTIMASSPTVAGVILGTAGYMSPEQARGQTVDRRADIWAFGVTLYEMLTGKTMFTGDTISDTLAAVLRADVDLDQLPKDTPVSIKRLLERCLDRNPKQRLRDIGEARIVIERARRGEVEEPSTVATPATKAPAGGRLAFAPWVLLVVAVVVIGFLLSNRNPKNQEVIRAYIPPPENSSYNLTPAHPGPAAMSSDGTKIAFAALSGGERVLWVRDIDVLEARPLPGTTDAGYPFWSPDGKSIGFFADGKLRRVDAGGGPPLTICEASNGKGGSWNEDGTIIFAPTAASGIFKVSAAGGEPEELFKVRQEEKENSNRFPQFLPDGRHFLYFARTSGETHYVRVGSLDGTVNKELMRGPAQAWYANGYLLFLRENVLMAQPFDVAALELTGEATPVADGVRRVTSIPLGVFSASQTGKLIYMTGAATEGSVLRWLDREGNVIGTTGSLAIFGDFQLSDDGKRVCAEIFEGGTADSDLWIYDVESGIRTRFTFDPGNDFNPVWSHDGNEIVFCSDRTGQFQLYRKSVTGSEPEVMIYESQNRKDPFDWSSDGRYVLFEATDSTGESSVWSLGLENREATRLTEEGTSCYRPSFSPDDAWFVFRAFENGKRIVYARKFPELGRKWQISSGEGLQARWVGSGNIFYQTVSGVLTEAAVTTVGSTIVLGKETQLFETRAGSAYDVLDDGSAFVEVYDESSKLASPLTLVVNWLADLEARP